MWGDAHPGPENTRHAPISESLALGMFNRTTGTGGSVAFSERILSTSLEPDNNPEIRPPLRAGLAAGLADALLASSPGNGGCSAIGSGTSTTAGAGAGAGAGAEVRNVRATGREAALMMFIASSWDKPANLVLFTAHSVQFTAMPAFSALLSLATAATTSWASTVMPKRPSPRVTVTSAMVSHGSRCSAHHLPATDDVTKCESVVFHC